MHIADEIKLLYEDLHHVSTVIGEENATKHIEYFEQTYCNGT